MKFPCLKSFTIDFTYVNSTGIVQRRDYHLILESHNQLSTRLDEVVVENQSLKDMIARDQTRMQKAIDDAASLDQANRDLGDQVQHLLKKSMNFSPPAYKTNRNATETAGNVISDHLVTFDDVKDLQSKNEQLLKVVCAVCLMHIHLIS